MSELPDVPDWAVNVPSAPGIHNLPEQVGGEWTRPFTVAQLVEIGAELLEQFLRRVVQAVLGFFPGGGKAFDLLSDWAAGVAGDIGSALSSVSQLAWNLLNDPVGTIGQLPQMMVEGLEGALSSVQGTIAWILGRLEDVPVIGDVIRIISGLGSRLFGFVPLANIADEPQSLLWNPGFTGAVSLDAAGGWSWDSAVYRTGGDSEPGSARAVADGMVRVIRSNGASVAAGKRLPVEVHVLADGLTGSGDLLQLGLVFFDGDTQVDSVIVDSVGVPTDPHSWAAGVPGARMAKLSGEVTIPAGVNRVLMRLIVTANAVAGTVWWDDADMKLSGLLQQSWVDGLPQALQDLLGFAQSIIDTVVQAITGVPVVGDFLGELFSAVDSLFNDAQDALGGLADLAWNLLNAPLQVLGTIPQSLVSGLTGLSSQVASLIGNLLSNPASVIGTIPQSLVAGLQTTLNQIGDIFNGLVVTPINSVVGSIANWFNSWFGGGSNQAIPISQKNAAWGVAPLDGNRQVPIANLPMDKIGGGGGPVVDPKVKHVLLELGDDQAVPAGATATLGGWRQRGGEPVTFDAAAAKWVMPNLPGWWDIEVQVAWQDGGSGSRHAALARSGRPGLISPVADGTPVIAGFPVRNSLVTTQDITDGSTVSVDDQFSVSVAQTGGTPVQVLGGYPGGTYVLAKYRGERQRDPGAVTLYVTDEGNNRVVKLDPDGVQTELFSVPEPMGIGVDSAGNVYVVASASSGRSLVRWDGSTLTEVATGLQYPIGIAIDSDDNVYTNVNGRIMRWDGAALTEATPWVQDPYCVAFDSNGVMHITSYQGNKVMRWDGTAVTDAFSVGGPYGIAFDSSDNVYIARSTDNRISRWDGTALTDAVTGLSRPLGVAVDATDNVYFTDSNNHRVMRLGADNTQTVLPFNGLRWPHSIAIVET